MQTKSGQAAAIIANPGHSARVDVWVANSAGTLVKVGSTGPSPAAFDGVLSVEVTGDVDAYMTARISVQRQMERWSRAPLVLGATNPLQASTPVFDVARKVRIEAVVTPPDSDVELTGSRTCLFEGFIDRVSWPDDEIELTCTDGFATLRDTWIEWERLYCFCQGANATKGAFVWRDTTDARPLALNDLVVPSSAKMNGHFYKVTAVTGAQATAEPTWPTGTGATVVSGGVTLTEAGATSDTLGIPVETLLQQLLTDNNLSGLFPAFTCPVSPGWQVRPYLQERSSVADALQAVVDQLGWALRMKFDSGSNSFKLTLFEPGRGKTVADKSVRVDEETQCDELEKELWSIRNVVRVVYSDSGTRDPTGLPTRRVVEQTDAASITKYGRRFMEIAEGSTSNIDTLAEAVTLASAVLADLKEPEVTLSIGVPCDPYLELGDLVSVAADNLRFTSAQLLGVVSFRQTFNDSSARTSFVLRGKPVARLAAWTVHDVRTTGDEDKHTLTLGTSTQKTTTVTPIVGGGRVRFTGVAAVGGKRIPDQVEVHVSSSPGFTPSAATLVGTAQGDQVDVGDLVPGRQYYLRTVPFGFNAQQKIRGAPSDEVGFIAGRAKTGHYDSTSTQSHLPLNGNFEHFSGGTALPPDHWLPKEISGETPEVWGTSANLYLDPDKGKCVIFPAVASARGRIVSNPFPVRRGIRSFNIYLSIKRFFSSAVFGKDLILDVYGFSDSDLTTQIINYSIYFSGDSAGPYPALSTWYDVVVDFGAGYGSIPSNVNFLQLVLRRGTAGDNTFAWAIGDIYVQEADFFRMRVDNLQVTTPPWGTQTNQDAWAAVTFQNSFSDFNTTSHQACAFFKDSVGVVHLKGLAKRATAALTTAIFTLPAGYRPAKETNFLVLANNRAAALRISTAGVVDITAADDASWFNFFSLNGITFDTR